MSQTETTPEEIPQERVYKLDEYKPPEYLPEAVELVFDIVDLTKVRVEATLRSLRLNTKDPSGETTPESAEATIPPALLLDISGKDPIDTIVINGVNWTIPEGTDALKDGYLSIPASALPSDQPFDVTITRTLNPSENKEGRGLYVSHNGPNDILVTQNESIGFRNITAAIDRPDAAAKFTTRVKADKKTFPTVLATGNLNTREDHEDGSTSYTYVCENKIPTYLYALVAGNFACVEDHVQTPEPDSKNIQLQVYCKPGNEERAKLGLATLKKILIWDQEVCGRKYPLDSYKIVVADDFNAGAMENFGLNIFSTHQFIASMETSTDDGLLRAVSTTAHEALHTWRGNLVTVRTWHEIALKEGLVKMTEGMFLEEFLGPTVGRISTVKMLRKRQFPQDAGKGAHSLRPGEYKGNPSNSMYSPTTYLKGAEVFNMLRVFVGDEKFNSAMNKYFKKYEGKAATIADLVSIFQENTGFNLEQFKLWFDQIGTPTCQVETEYNEDDQELTMTIKQSSPGEPHFTLQFPLAIGLMTREGREIHLEVTSAEGEGHDLQRGILNITQNEQKFTFKNVPPGTIPSLLRRFSAPVKLDYEYSPDQLLKLMQYDTDGFNRYEAGQRITHICLKRLLAQYQSGQTLSIDEETLKAYETVLDLANEDPALTAEMLALPDPMEIVQHTEPYDFEAVKEARDFLRLSIAQRLETKLAITYHQQKELGNTSTEDEFGVISTIKNRKLQNICLYYLMALGNKYLETTKNQFQKSTNMSAENQALKLLCEIPEEREEAINRFYEKWRNERTLVDLWFLAQSLTESPDTIERVRNLTTSHPDFKLDHPSGIYSLLHFGFCENHTVFHDKSGQGYGLITDIVLRMKNEEVASNLVQKAFGLLPKLDTGRQKLIRTQLGRILEADVPEGVKTVAQKLLA